MEKEKREKRKVSLAGAVAACVLCLLLGGTAALGGLWAAVGSDGVALLQVQALIHTRFIGDYDPDQVRQEGERAMVDALGDRWSHYFTPEQLAKTLETRKNSYVGIGLSFLEDPDGLLVTKVNPDGPADQAGIRVGEVICAVEGTPITPENREESVERIRGDAGTDVTLEIQAEDGTRRAVTVTRRTVKGQSASWYLLEDDVAVLTIANFYTGTARQVETCLAQLRQAGAQALIIDVRNDPGGYLQELLDILDQLLPEGVIFRVEYYNGREEVIRSDASCVELPMAVIVNENSYSAAEFLAAQVQETTGAPVVGTRTSGKGYSQNLYRLRDGGAVNLSNARYKTAAGVSLAGKGLVPDPYIGMCYARQVELIMETLEPERDGQLQAAVEAVKANSVSDASI